MSDPLLPPMFAVLEPFAARWCLATETERFATRMASTMTEMQAFYDVAFPRIGDALEHCDQYPLDDLPDAQLNLLYLVYSTIMVAMCVEIWHQPRILDAANAQLDRIASPIP